MPQVFYSEKYQTKIGNITKVNDSTIRLSNSTFTIGVRQFLDTGNLDCNLATSGAGGLDTGSEAASTLYSLYAVNNSGNPAIVASVSSIAPTGFSSYTKIGTLYNNSSSNIEYYGPIDKVRTGTAIPYIVGVGGYLKCDGSAISRTIFADLFAVIGTTYGVGDGSTTFNLPTSGLNTFAAQVTYTNSITSQIGGWLSSVSSSGRILTFTTNFFSVAPTVQAHPIGGGGNNFQMGTDVRNVSTTSVEIYCTKFRSDATVKYQPVTDHNYHVTATRQGTDSRDIAYDAMIKI